MEGACGWLACRTEEEIAKEENINRLLIRKHGNPPLKFAPSGFVRARLPAFLGVR